MPVLFFFYDLDGKISGLRVKIHLTQVRNEAGWSEVRAARTLGVGLALTYI